MPKPKKVRIQHAEIVRHFAESLRAMRRSRGMTQAELARQAHLTETYISRLESAGAAPGIDLVDRLAKALGVTLIDLLALPSSPDTAGVLRQQSKRLFDAVTRTDDCETLSLLNQFLAMLAEVTAKKR